MNWLPARKETLLLLNPSSFPRGRFGVGLLVLRAAFGMAILAHGLSLLTNDHATMRGIGGGLAATAAGSLLVAGLLTSLLAAISGGLCAWILVPSLPGGLLVDVRGLAILAVFVGLSIALLGPGAFSIDALLFGPREIVIPPVRKFEGKDREGLR